MYQAHVNKLVCLVNLSFISLIIGPQAVNLKWVEGKQFFCSYIREVQGPLGSLGR